MPLASLGWAMPPCWPRVPRPPRPTVPPLGGGTAVAAGRAGGTRVRDLHGSAEPQCSLCRRRREGTADATSLASGDLGFAERGRPHRGPHRPHPPTCFREGTGHPSPAEEESRTLTGAFQRLPPGVGLFGDCLGHAAFAEVRPAAPTCGGASGTLHLRRGWRRAEAAMFLVLEEDTGQLAFPTPITQERCRRGLPLECGDSFAALDCRGASDPPAALSPVDAPWRRHYTPRQPAFALF